MPKRATRSTAKRFTKVVRDTILKSLAAGNFRETACRRAKVTDRSFRRWIERGDHELQLRDEALEKVEQSSNGRGEVPELSEYGEFALAVRNIESTAEAKCLGVIMQGEPDDVRWFLERRYPKRWGRNAMRVEVSGPDGGAVKVEDARRSLFDRLTAQVARLAAQEGAEESDPQSPE